MAQVRNLMAGQLMATTARVLRKIGTAPALIGWRIVKSVIYLALVLIFAASVYTIINVEKLRFISEFQALRRVDPLPEAKKLVEEKGYCEALGYLDDFRQYDYVRDNPDVTAFYNHIKSKRDSIWFRGQDTFDGIWKGRGACPESLISATAADFFVVGDVRDLVWQGVKKYRGEEVDEFTVALAGAGVVLAGVTWGSAGASAPFKGSVSLLKTGKRLDKISGPMQKSLIGVLKNSAATKSIEPFRPLANSLHGLATAPGVKTRDVFAVLSRSSKLEDVQHAAEFAKAFGHRSGRLLQLGGGSSIEVFRKFGKGERVAEAMDHAFQFGSKGTNLLQKLGPTKFMTYLKITKYGVRGARSIRQDRLNVLMATGVKFLPDWSLWAIAALSGFAVILVPAKLAVRGWRHLRRPTPATT
jgi:hypothetical protein